VAVGAGQAHSLAVTASGAVYAWGLNAQGQLGDGTTTPRLTPVLLAGLAGITSVAGGSGHSVALDGTDAVWTWGLNTNGQLGDGTTTPELAVAPVSGGDLSWGVAPPVFTPAGGTYASAQAVAVTSATPGATIRYTTSGVEPTESDPVVPSSLVLGTPTVVKARAWKGSLAPSPTATASDTFPLPLPAATPAGGLYAEPPTVTLGGAAGAAIRYTTNGTDPTEASPAYSGPTSRPTR
jgi:hypothetical protein